ncbi:unnamed protein product [Linum trigynum]|uniref:DUF4283 domain-containing protein n=1 Tax=Linum trigynum TaxID=586398 RepID=A0AAV2E7L0_9ROSI
MAAAAPSATSTIGGELKPPDPTAGIRRPPEVSSSPDGKKAQEEQHPKKRVRPLSFTGDSSPMDEVIVEDITLEEQQETHRTMSPRTMEPENQPNMEKEPPAPPTKPSAWGEGRKKLFSEAVKEVEWYVAKSDSEDIAEAMREEDNEDEDLEDENPLCPTISFSSFEWHKYRREWRSAIVVKVLGRSFPYPVIARRLNMLWARTGIIQVTNRRYGYYFVIFTTKADYEHALTGGPWMIGDH